MRTSNNSSQLRQYDTVAKCVLYITILSASRLIAATNYDDIEASLARMNRPWMSYQHRLTLDEYKATLVYWESRHKDILKVEKRGMSVDGLPIYLLRITAPEISDDDKQVALITALHGGPERSGSTTALHIAEWLLGNSPEAVETRRKQIVLIMPIPNPHAFFVMDQFGNGQGIDPYGSATTDNSSGKRGWNAGVKLWDLSTLAFNVPEKAPEIVAVKSVVDEYQPELHTDLHGVGLQEFPVAQLSDRRIPNGIIMVENSGMAYSNIALRPWDPRVLEVISAAAREKGYGTDRPEADAQRLFFSPAYDVLKEKYWNGGASFYTAHYGYAKHHTMIAASEIAWEESGLVRTRALLGIGNGTWLDERVPGYPVNRVAVFPNHFVTSFGQNASARRRSRVELWSKQGGFSLGQLYPSIEGMDTFVCAVNSDGASKLDSNLQLFLEKLQGVPYVKAETIVKICNAIPAFIKLAFSSRGIDTAEANTSISNGIGFRLRLSYLKPELLDVRVNGHLLQQSAIDGYECWYADGYTQVQINVPPEKARDLDLFIITCVYKPDVQRAYGWKPPQQVLERLTRK